MSEMQDKGRRDAMAPTRRQFLGTAALGAGAILTAASSHAQAAAPNAARPNILFILCDQLGLDAISAHGSPDVHTPNIDRLVARGMTFIESHSTSPVCSPARSSLLTGRMPTETGVITNDRPIHGSVPDLGQWLRQADYDTVYCGKWHLPHGYPAELAGFRVLPVGAAQGDLVDEVVARSCQAYLRNRDRSRPFVLVASYMQPHDICYWAIKGRDLVPEELAFPLLEGRLPELPPNHRSRPAAPAHLDRMAYKQFSDAQWRYYLYVYYRQVEMLDADVGRLLDAIEDSGEADNTVIVFTADHGDGRGRHQHVQKWYPYEEAVKTPLVFSWPGEIPEGVRDAEHLVSGVDMMGTLCDYAGVEPPRTTVGRNLRPLLEQRDAPWRDYLVFDTHIVGRTVRTAQYKYVRYEDDPVEQLFDMVADPWETVNLYQEARYADVVADHRKMLEEWTERLDPVEPTPSAV